MMQTVATAGISTANVKSRPMLSVQAWLRAMRVRNAVGAGPLPGSGRAAARLASADGLPEALSDAVLAIAAEHAVEPVLQKLVDAARELAAARYAAIGVPDGEGGFSRFITSGMSDELIASLGELPRQHGMLGAILESGVPHRTTDIRSDPRFRGWWPAAHPRMGSFLGVPIVARGNVAGAFYLTDKEGAEAFSDDDQALIETFAAHAALAIENARLHERSRELSIVEERNRLARELHDAVTQKLFGVVLAAESGAAMLERDAARPASSCGSCARWPARRWTSCAR